MLLTAFHPQKYATNCLDQMINSWLLIRLATTRSGIQKSYMSRTSLEFWVTSFISYPESCCLATGLICLTVFGHIHLPQGGNNLW